jgi:penicillin-binding protein-related factor A (putative recombinase)
MFKPVRHISYSLSKYFLAGLFMVTLVTGTFGFPTPVLADFPAVASSNSGNSGGNTTASAITMPSGVTSGDLLFVIFTKDGTAAPTSITGTGWNTLSGASSGETYLIAYWKIADGSDTLTVNHASEGTAYVVYRITGADAATAPAEGTIATGSSANPNPPSLNPAGWDVEDTLWIAAYGWDNNRTNSSYPANYTDNQQTSGWSNANGSGIAAATRNNASASEDPGTGTISTTDGWAAQTYAIRPAPPAPPTVTTGVASAVGSDIATLNGAVTATIGSSVTRRGFAWGTNSSLSGGDTATTTETGTFGVGSFSTNLTNINPGTTYYFRAYAVNSNGTSTGSIQSFTTSSILNWNATDWTLFDTITISPANIAADLTNFPVYVNLADLTEQFWNTTSAASSTVGTDIRVTNLAGQELPRELVFASSTTETGELHFRADSVSSTTDTIFKIWYNGTTTGDYARDAVYGSENVWTNNFLGVWHLGELGNNNAGGYLDSTRFAHHGTGTSMTAATTQSGPVGNGQIFNGSNQSIRIGRTSTLEPATSLHISAWTNRNGAQTTNYAPVFLYGPDTSAPYPSYGFYRNGSSVTDYGFKLTSASTIYDMFGLTLNDQEWTHIVGQYDGTHARTFQNGVQIGTTTASFSIGYDGVSGLVFASRQDAARFYRGSLDEVRIASTSRSQAWIQAEYLNQATTTDFYTVSEASADLPLVVTDPATSVSATGATFNGNVGFIGSSDVTVRGFAWGTNSSLSGGDTATTTETGTFGTGSFTAARTGLAPNTTYYFRAYAVNSNGTSTGSIQSFTTTSVPAENWNATAWTLYDVISIDASNIAADLTNFPVYVDLSDLSSQFWSTTPTGSTTVGTDIRVTNAANQELPRELVFASSTAETGELHFRADSISSTTDTIFKIWYNGTTTSDYARGDTYGSENVWSNNFLGVWHLNERGNNNSGGYLDSTRFAHHGTGASLTATSTQSSPLGSGQVFNGTNQRIRVSRASTLEPASSLYISAWTLRNGTQTTSWAPIVLYGPDSTTPFRTYGFYRNGSQATDYGMKITSASTGYDTWGITLNDQEWTHMVGQYDGSNVRTYRNGAQVATTTASFTLSYDGVSDLLFASRHDNARHYRGTIDEIRIASTSRSQAWIQAEYLNQATSTDFYTLITAPTVTTNAVTATTSTSGTLNGTITNDGGASSTVRGFAWGTNSSLSGGDTATTTETGTFGVGAFTANLTSLTPGTTYYYRAYAVNTVGTSTGSIQSFTTFSPPTVSTAVVNPLAVGSVSVAIQGAITVEGNASSTVRGFAWGTNSSLSGGDTATTTETGTFGVSNFARKLSGLTPGTTYYYRAYAVSSVGTSTGSILSFTTRTPSAAVWNPTDWTLFDTITIASTSIDANLTDFPVYVNLADLSATFWATTPTGSSTVGTDIRVTTADNTEVPRELVFASSTAETGELHFKAPTISSSTDTIFKIWYNGTTTGDYARDATYGTEHVWSNGYVGVWHLGEAGNTNAGGYLDSSGYANHGIGTSMTTASRVVSPVGGGQAFDGSADFITVPNPTQMNVGTGPFTVTTWASTTVGSAGGSSKIFSKRTGSFNIIDVQLSSRTTFGIELRGAITNNGTSDIRATGWRYLTAMRDGSNINLYVDDGADEHANTSAESINNTGDFMIASCAICPSTERFNGQLDEARFATTSRSTAWIQAEYLNQATTTDFYTVTEPQAQDGSFIRAQASVFSTFADPATATFGSTPTEGNLLVAIAGDRSGGNADNFTISGSGWTKVIADTTLAGDSNARRTHVVWYKIAGVSEPTGITVDDGTANSKTVLIQEFAASGVADWSLLATTSANTGTGSASPLASGETASLPAGNKLLIGTALWRKEAGNTPTGVAFLGLAGVEDYAGGSNHLSISSALGSSTSAGTASTSLSWSGASHEGNVGLLVFSTEGLVLEEEEPTGPGVTIITGTLYAEDGVTPLAGKTVVAAVGTSTPSLHSTTTATNGSFSITSIATSTGGGSWTGVSHADSINALTYGNGRFVAVGNYLTNMRYSNDGVTWNSATTPQTNQWTDVTYGNGKFVAVACSFGTFACNTTAGGSRVAWSHDGITWNLASSSESNHWRAITFGNGTFVAVSDNGTNRVMYSIDGITWATTSAATQDGWYDVTYGEGRFVAVGYYDVAGKVMMYSDDGVTWNSANEPNTNTYQAVTYGNGRFVAVSTSGTNRVAYSDDGITWTAVAAPENNSWDGLTYANGRYVAVTFNGTSRVMYSDNGVNWTLASSSNQNGYLDVTYGNGRFVAAGYFIANSNIIMYSDAGFGEDTPITLFVDGDTIDATTLTYGVNNNSGTTTIYANLIADTVLLQKNRIASSSNEIYLSNADFYDSTDDPDILFTATTSTTTINGTFFIPAGTKVFGPQNLLLGSHFTNYGTFSAERGTIELDGSFRQLGSIDAVGSTLNVNGPDQAAYDAVMRYLGGIEPAGFIEAYTMLAVGNVLYIAGYAGNGTCVPATGSECEIQVYDISSTTNPVYLTGRESGAGADGWTTNSLAVSGNTLYVGRGVYSGACVPSTGAGCELLVYNIASTTNPVYVTGRESSSGSGGDSVNIVAVIGNALYVGTGEVFGGNGTCVPSTGAGCELLVYNIASTTNPVYVTGRESSSGSNGRMIGTFLVHESVLYIGTGDNFADNGTCAPSTGNGCELLVFSVASTTNPVYLTGLEAGGLGGNRLLGPLAVSGSVLYANRNAYIGECIVSTGSGCEHLVYDISSTTNPMYLTGRELGDVNGGAILISDTVMYVGRNVSSSVACDFATSDGCELLIFDISSSTNPSYVSGRESGVSGSDGGLIYYLYQVGETIYLFRYYAGACVQATGLNCDLLILEPYADQGGQLIGSYTGVNRLGDTIHTGLSFFRTEIASTSSLTIHGTTTLPNQLSVGGDYTISAPTTYSFYNSAQLTFDGNVAQTISGTLTGTNHLPNTSFTGQGLKTITSNASTSDFTILSGASVTASAPLTTESFINAGTFNAPTHHTLRGSYTNSGTVDHADSLTEVRSYIQGILAGREPGVTSGGSTVNTLTIVGTTLYLGRNFYTGTCNTTTGEFCELLVYDISSTTNPVFVTGRESGSGSGGGSVISLASFGTTLYLGRAAYGGACVTSTGAGCELLVYDISSTTNPIYLTGRESGVSTNGGQVSTLTISNTTLYLGRQGYTGTCNTATGEFCELLVYDISSTTNPVFVTGRESGVSSGGSNVRTLTTLGATLYLGRDLYSGTCNTTTGEFCELLVYDISSTTNPVFVTGRESGVSSNGGTVYTLTTVGTALYVGRNSYFGTCNTTTGEFCELLVYDISSSTNPVFITGRESGVSSAGAAVYTLITSSATLYLGRNGSLGTCNTATGEFCELLVYDISSTTNPDFMTGRESGVISNGGAVNTLTTSGATTLYLGRNGSLGTCNTATGEFCELLVYDLAASFNGAMTGTSAFNDLSVEVGAVRFNNPASTTGTMSMAPGTTATFNASSTYTFQDIDWEGTAGMPIILQSSASGTPWYLDVPGSQVSVSYLDVSDSDATLTEGGIQASTSTDSGRNCNWDFGSGVVCEINAETGPLVWNATDWTLYDTITIASSSIDANLTDFPVYVNLADLSELPSGAPPQLALPLVGTDIRVTTADNVEVPRELVFASSTAQTGEFHFKAPTISSSTNTVFKIWYNGTTTGDYARTATYGTENVWTNDFVGVYHMQQNPTGASSTLDSTSNRYHGTGGAGLAASDLVAGKVGNAVNFDTGGGNHFINIGSGSKLDNMPSYTMCTWYSHDTFPQMYAILMGKTSNGALTNGNQMYIRNNGSLAAWSIEQTYIEAAGSVGSAGWQYLCGSWAGGSQTATTTLRTFKNGTQLTTITESGDAGATQNDAANDFYLGLPIGDSLYEIDGRMDEVRISSTTRSAAWIRAEYLNQSTTTSFYTLGEPVTLTLTNHTAGTISNTFSFANKTDEELFTFRLEPEESTDITELTLSVLGISDLDIGDLTDWRLYVDNDNDADLDGGDTQVGGAGSFDFSGGTGLVTFTSDFTVTTATNFIVTADLTSINNNASVGLWVLPAGITAVTTEGALPVQVSGATTRVSHNRSNRGGGGSSARFGGDAPPGAGIVSGGGPGGGQGDTPLGQDNDGDNIAPDPNFFRPTGQSGDWTNGANALISNNTRAQAPGTVSHVFRDFGFSIPGGNTISGIIVKLDSRYSSGQGTISVDLSYNEGANYSETRTTPTLTASDVVYTLGGVSDVWGRSWTPTQLNNTNFRVRVTANTALLELDGIEVSIYHQATGGGAGGGGAF